MSRTLKESLSASAGSPTLSSIIKATDSSEMLPKKKHVEALLTYTHRQDISIQELTEHLFERTEESTWIVVLKTLHVMHRLLRDGHERFANYMVTRNHLFDFHSFNDRKSPRGASMSAFIKNYGAYLNEKVVNIRQFGFDICHVKGARQAKIFSTQSPPELFKSMSAMQNLMDSLLDNMAHIDAANVESQGHGNFQIEVKGGNQNVILKGAIYLLYQDLLRIFVSLNDGIVNILERYFTMPKAEAVDAYKIYCRFTDACGKMDQFLEACKRLEVLDENKQLPDLQQAPTVLMPKMKEYIDNYGTVKAGGTMGHHDDSEA